MTMTDKTQLFLEKFKGDFDEMQQAAPDMVKGCCGDSRNSLRGRDDAGRPGLYAHSGRH
jgi:hypothetical protein